MNKSFKRLSLWLMLGVCLLIGSGAVFQCFNGYGRHLPVVVIEPKLVPSGNYASPVIGYVFTNDKEDGKPSKGKDSIGMQISYANVGSNSASDVKRSVVTLLRKDNKFTVLSVDTSSINTPRPAQPDVNMVDTFYLPNFLPSDTQFIYVKFNYYNKAGKLMEPLREMFTYNHGLLNQHLPATDGNSYAGVKRLLLSRHLW